MTFEIFAFTTTGSNPSRHLVPPLAGLNRLAHFGKNLLGGSDVLSDLGNEFVGAGETQLIAKPFYEPDGDMLAIDVLVKIEKMRLERKLVIAEGWIISEVCCAPVPFAVNFGFHHIDANSRPDERRHSDVCSWKAQTGSSSSAGDHSSADFKGAAEELVGLRDLSFCDHLANGRAADVHIVKSDFGDGVDLEAVQFAQLSEKGNVALTAVPELVIVADNNRPDTNFLNENRPPRILWQIFARTRGRRGLRWLRRFRSSR